MYANINYIIIASYIAVYNSLENKNLNAHASV